MKKFLSALMAMVISLSIMVVPVMAEDVITVTLDGEKIEFDVQPQIINERTMVPVRAIFEAIGATVDWDQDTQTVTSSKGDTFISLTIDEPVMYVNGVAKELDTPALIIDERTLVPARAISEAYGLYVDWVQETQTVVITTTAPETEPPVEDTPVEEVPTETIKQAAMYKLANGIIEKGEYLAGENAYVYIISYEDVDVLLSYTVETGQIGYMEMIYVDEAMATTAIMIYPDKETGLAYDLMVGYDKFTAYGTFKEPSCDLDFISSDIPSEITEASVLVILNCIETFDMILAMEFDVSIYDLGINY